MRSSSLPRFFFWGLIAPLVFSGLWSALAASATWPAATFPPPPRLATTTEALAILQTDPAVAERRSRTLAQADAQLAAPVELPDGSASWIFYYACPQHGTRLEAQSPEAHRCPTCGEVFSDERTQASWRTTLHYAAEHAALQLAWAYAFSQEDRYAAEVRRILLHFAQAYASYPARRDRWGREGALAPWGGRRYVQSLDEAVGATRLAPAYDLVRNSPVWSDAERQQVELDFFRATADSLLVFNLGISNHQTWLNAGLMHIASVLGDAALIQQVLTMTGGVKDQLHRSVGDDGLWYEGAIAYHNYALQAMVAIADATRRVGIPVHEHPRFRSMITAPAQAAFSDGFFAAINDSDRVHLGIFNWAFDWAEAVYAEPGFAARIQRVPDDSHVLEASGLAFLRLPGEGFHHTAVLDFGPHGGGHGHYDKLNLIFHAGGHEWLLDPGRLTYSHAEYQTWVKTTAAHNTVVLGGTSQQATTGTLRWLESGPGWTATAVESRQAYPGALLRRYVVLLEDLLVDLFEVTAPEETQIDWLWHLDGALQPKGLELTEAGETLGSESGYQHLRSVQSLVIAPGQTLVFRRATGAGMEVLPIEPETPLLLATGIGRTIDHAVPTLVRRRQANHTVFATLLFPEGSPRPIVHGPTARGGDRYELILERAGRRWQLQLGPSAPRIDLLSPSERPEDRLSSDVRGVDQRDE